MLTWKKSGVHTLSALPGSAQRFVTCPLKKRELLDIRHTCDRTQHNIHGTQAQTALANHSRGARYSTQTGWALEPYGMVFVSSQTDARYGCAG
jgi:hypothetical protein